MPTKFAEKYLLIAILTAVLALGAVAVFNAIIDPFSMNLAINIPGINTYKSETLERVRLLKAYEIRRYKPDAIILGSSRSHIGINPTNANLLKRKLKTYNLAFDSATPKEMYFYLQHAQAIRPLKLVVLGLDGYQANDEPAGTTSDFDESLLMKDASFFSKVKMALTDLRILTSLDTFKSSLATIHNQHTGRPVWFSPNGQRLGIPFFRRKDSDMGRLGPRGYFDKFERAMFKDSILSNKKSPAAKKAYHESTDGKQDRLSSLDYVNKIVQFCRSHDIELKIFFTPAHVDEMESSAAESKWDKDASGKRKVLKILDRDALLHPDKKPIPLYDFSLYSTITTDPLPPKNSLQEMKYYWDYSHFKDFVGDMVLNRILNENESNNLTPVNFGILISDKNIGDVVAQLNRDHALYQKSHPQDIQRIKAWIQELKNGSN